MSNLFLPFNTASNLFWYSSNQTTQDKNGVFSRKQPIKEDKLTLWKKIERTFIAYLSISGQFLSGFKPLYPPAVILANVLSLIPKADALQIQTNQNNPSDYGADKANSISLRSFNERKTGGIIVIAPFDNLMLSSALPYSEQINMKQFFQLSDPESNLEIHLIQSNGLNSPDWINLNMGDMSMIRSYYLNGEALDLVGEGSYLYVALNNAIKVLDITNPTELLLLGTTMESMDTYRYLYFGPSIFINGNYLYYANSNRIDFFDKSNLNQLILKFTLTLPYNTFFSDMALQDNFLYSIQYLYNSEQFYLMIYDVTNPLNPVSVKNLPLSGISNFGEDIYVDKNHAFVHIGSSLQLFDISNPSNPIIQATLSISDTGRDSLCVKDNYFYLANIYSLDVWDITQFSSPFLINSFPIGFPPSQMKIEGNYLYLLDNHGQILIYNLENPANPTFVTSCESFGIGYNFIVENNIIYIANSYAGLSIMNSSRRNLKAQPSASNRGLWQMQIVATDELGDQVSEPRNVYVDNVNISKIPNQAVFVGTPTLFTFDPATFEYPQTTFNYTANLAGGNPLPQFIHFDPLNRAFFIDPQSGDQNTYPIVINAVDNVGSTYSTSFNITVPDRSPFISMPFANQTAYSGTTFQYVFDIDSFGDLDNDTLAFSAREIKTDGLPEWLNFDPVQRVFFGTPFGKAEYPIEVTATDGFGGVVTNEFTISIPSSPPIILNTPDSQIASINTPFIYIIPADVFYSIDDDLLTYSTGPLPPFLTFSPANSTFFGAPKVFDAGSYSIEIYAENSSGQSTSAAFSLSVVSTNGNPPVLIKPIPDVKVIIGVPFSYSFDDNTFEEPDGGPLAYQAVLEGGGALPPGVYFNSDTRTLSGEFHQLETLRISILAYDQQGAYATTTFGLTVAESAHLPPIVLNPLSNANANVGNPFYYHIPENTFADADGDDLKITIHLLGGKPLPKWLHWKPSTSSLSGTPGVWDTGTFKDNILKIEVWASDGFSSAKTTFQISVQGESFWEIFLKAGISLTSLAVTSYGYYKNRAILSNFLKKSSYLKPSETIFVDESYFHSIGLDYKKIESFKVFQKGNLLSKLPDGIVYKEGAFRGVPTLSSIGKFTIRIYTHGGYVHEEFILTIKNRDSGQLDAQDDPGDLLSSISHCFKKKEKSSIMMMPILPQDKT